MHVVADPDNVRSLDVHVDGRSLRRERNREAVIESFLALVREGNFDPGGAEIAERAGVSHRSVFRYFDDLADLMLTAINRELERCIPMGALDNIGVGSFDERLERLVDARLTMFEHVQGIATVTRLRSVTIPALRDEFASIAAKSRLMIEQHFATEIRALPADRRDLIVDAVQVLTSWDVYDFHVRVYGHSVERIRASTLTAVTELLTG